MGNLRSSLALALILPLQLWGSSQVGSQSRQEKKIVVEPGAPRQGWLGIQIQDLTPERAKELQVGAGEGALVTDVTSESPAEKGGIKKDDVVVEFNGRMIYDSDGLVKAVRRTTPGTSTAVVVVRKEGKKNLQVTLGKLKRRLWSVGPDATIAPFTRRMRFIHASLRYGMQLADLNSQLGEYFGAPGGKGVLVEEVEKESEGAKAGFMAGDVILRIGDEKVEDLNDVSDALEDFKEGERAGVEILRKGSRQTLSLTIEDDDISGAMPLFDGERALRENLGKMHESLDRIREDTTLRRKLREELGRIREEFGPEFQKQMKTLKHQLEEMGNRVRVEAEQLRSQYALPRHTL